MLPTESRNYDRSPDNGQGELMNKRYKITYTDYVWASTPEKALSMAEAEIGVNNTTFAEFATVEEVEDDD
jgi:hypothetical protein